MTLANRQENTGRETLANCPLVNALEGAMSSRVALLGMSSGGQSLDETEQQTSINCCSLSPTGFSVVSVFPFRLRRTENFTRWSTRGSVMRPVTASSWHDHSQRCGCRIRADTSVDGQRCCADLSCDYSFQWPQQLKTLVLFQRGCCGDPRT